MTDKQLCVRRERLAVELGVIGFGGLEEYRAGIFVLKRSVELHCAVKSAVRYDRHGFLGVIRPIEGHGGVNSAGFCAYAL